MSRRKHEGSMQNKSKDIDYDFFDSPGRSSPSPDQGRGKSDRNDDETGSDSSSDSDSYDSGSEHHSRASAKKTIHANVPSVAMPESDSEQEQGMSGKQASPRNRYSSDTNSDSEPEYAKKKQNGKKQESVRPKTSMAKSRRRRNQHQSDKNQADRYHSDSDSGRSNSSSGSYTGTSDSEASDITDVSPLASPINTPKNASSKKKVMIGETTAFPYGDSRPPRSPLNRDRPKSGKSSERSSVSPSYDHLLQPDKDSMNLKLLMHAIMEMEGGRNSAQSQSSNFSMPRERPSSASRKSMSFRNEQIRDIDRENQRLMREIMNYATSVKKAKRQKTRPQQQPVAVTNKLTPSAVNRLREQKRIEQENQSFLRRLEGARATRTLNRDALLTDFGNKKFCGVPMSMIHPNERHKKRSPYDQPVTDFDLRSDTGSVTPGFRSISRPSSAKSTTRPSSAKSAASSRPSSAKSNFSTASSRPSSAKRPLSGKRPPSRPKPAWDERW